MDYVLFLQLQRECLKPKLPQLFPTRWFRPLFLLTRKPQLESVDAPRTTHFPIDKIADRPFEQALFAQITPHTSPRFLQFQTLAAEPNPFPADVDGITHCNGPVVDFACETDPRIENFDVIVSGTAMIRVREGTGREDAVAFVAAVHGFFPVGLVKLGSENEKFFVFGGAALGGDNGVEEAIRLG